MDHLGPTPPARSPPSINQPIDITEHYEASPPWELNFVVLQQRAPWLTLLAREVFYSTNRIHRANLCYTRAPIIPPRVAPSDLFLLLNHN